MKTAKKAGILEKLKPVLPFIGFLIAVLPTYQGAARGMPWLGLVAVAIVVTAHLTTWMRQWYKVSIILTLSIGAIGFVLDSTLISTGVYTSPARWIIPSPFCAEWTLALWLNFGFLIFSYLRWLRRKDLLATVVGIVFAILVYSNSAGMGIIKLSLPSFTSVLIVAVIWAVLIPLIYRLADWVVIRSVAAKKG